MSFRDKKFIKASSEFHKNVVKMRVVKMAAWHALDIKLLSERIQMVSS